MKHLGPEHSELLDHLARESGVALKPSAIQELLEYLDRVIEANRSLNLTRITSPEAAVRLHLLDSLLPLPGC